MEKAEFLDRLANLTLEGKRDELVALVRQGLENKIATPYEMLNYGLGLGMKKAGELYEQRVYFVPECLLACDAMYGALDLVLPLLKKEISDKGMEAPGKIVIGVVEGDIHDIGKNIVAALVEAAGFEVIDLGRDVPIDDFIQTAMDEGAQVIAASTLMTPTLDGMQEIEDKLKEKGMKGSVKTIIGGGATSKEYATEIGADAYAKDAMEGVSTIRRMVEEIKVAMEELKKRYQER